jgi:hypothetical protein
MSAIAPFDIGFDVKTTPVVEFFERQDPLPIGTYQMRATSAQRKPTKQCENCWYWQLDFTVIGGDYRGRIFPIRFNIVNTNPEAEAIGRGQLCSYLHCIDNRSPKSEADLCGVPVRVTVTIKKRPFTDANGKDREGMVNEVVRLEPCTAQSDEPMPF